MNLSVHFSNICEHLDTFEYILKLKYVCKCIKVSQKLLKIY